jgi:hypothetical protein
MYSRKARALNNAYMLVYVREGDWAKVMQPTGAEEVQEHVRKQLEAQLMAKDRKRRAKMQAHRFVTFNVVTQATIEKHVRLLHPPFAAWHPEAAYLEASHCERPQPPMPLSACARSVRQAVSLPLT